MTFITGGYSAHIEFENVSVLCLVVMPPSGLVLKSLALFFHFKKCLVENKS